MADQCPNTFFDRNTSTSYVVTSPEEEHLSSSFGQVNGYVVRDSISILPLQTNLLLQTQINFLEVSWANISFTNASGVVGLSPNPFPSEPYNSLAH